MARPLQTNHGTAGMYRRGCRCTHCASYTQNYNAQYYSGVRVAGYKPRRAKIMIKVTFGTNPPTMTLTMRGHEPYIVRNRDEAAKAINDMFNAFYKAWPELPKKEF